LSFKLVTPSIGVQPLPQYAIPASPPASIEIVGIVRVPTMLVTEVCYSTASDHTEKFVEASSSELSMMEAYLNRAESRGAGEAIEAPARSKGMNFLKVAMLFLKE
jgi:hypothetical protein